MAFFRGPNIVTDGLVFAIDAGSPRSYPGSGTTVSSLTNSIDGTLINGVGFNNANGGSWVLDGINDSISIGSTTDFPFGTGDFTLEAWFKPIETGNGWTGVISKGASGNTGFAMNYRSYPGGPISLRMSIDAPDNSHYSSGNLTSGEIYHIVMVFDRDTAGFVYNNGELTYTHTGVATQNQSVDNSLQLRLGTYTGGSWFMEGNIYSVRTYNRALTADEVSQNYNAQKSRFGL